MLSDVFQKCAAINKSFQKGLSNFILILKPRGVKGGGAMISKNVLAFWEEILNPSSKGFHMVEFQKTKKNVHRSSKRKKSFTFSSTLGGYSFRCCFAMSFS